MVTITPEETNNNGLLNIIGDKLRSIQVQVIPSFDNGSTVGADYPSVIIHLGQYPQCPATMHLHGYSA